MERSKLTEVMESPLATRTILLYSFKNAMYTIIFAIMLLHDNAAGTAIFGLLWIFNALFSKAGLRLVEKMYEQK